MNKLALLALALAAADASAQQTTKLSKTTTGGASFGVCETPTLSRDGRFGAFVSDASDLVLDDFNAKRDVFLVDRQTHLLERVSVGVAAAEADGASWHAMLAGDGTAIVFESAATNLIGAGNDLNGFVDVYVRELPSGPTTLVSRTPAGKPGNGQSLNPWISADARFVAFDSTATDLVAGDLGGHTDVFVLDRQTGIMTRESVTSGGAGANGDSRDPAISDDGRYVAFLSSASNLVPFFPTWTNVCLRDRLAGTTTLISKSASGVAAGKPCSEVCISARGNVVAFATAAFNLVPEDLDSNQDVYVWRAATGLVARESVSATGGGLDQHCTYPALSADGRYLGFTTGASGVALEPDGPANDVFQRDLDLGRNWVVSIPAIPGLLSNGHSDAVAFDGDGSDAVFVSTSNVMAGAAPIGTVQAYARGFKPPMQPSLGYRHGASMLAIGGAPLASGNAAQATLFHAPPNRTTFVLVGLGNQPTFTPILNAPLVTIPLALVLVGATDANGVLAIPFTGGTGPTTLTVQCATSGLNVPGYPYDLSNAVEVHLLP